MASMLEGAKGRSSADMARRGKEHEETEQEEGRVCGQRLESERSDLKNEE